MVYWIEFYRCWKTCMSSPPFGKLWVPDPNRSFTDCDNWAAPGPVSEKLRYCGFCNSIMKKYVRPLIMLQLMTNCINLTLLEISCGRLCATRYFQFARTWNGGDVCSSTTRKHCICLHFCCRRASICSFYVTKVLWNAFCAGWTLRRWCASSWMTRRWCFIFATRCGTCLRIKIKILIKSSSLKFARLHGFTCWLLQ
jgi:hypothetical protein